MLLCVAQISGSSILILGCMALYMALLAWSCYKDFTLPVLLFFLPWSPIMRTSPTEFSFYTFGMVMICLIGMVKNGFSFKNYQIRAGIILLFLSLLSKLLDGSKLSFAYIAFIMMVLLLPTVKEETREGEYDFFQVVLFFSAGVIISSLCAQNFAEMPNIKQYIHVNAYLNIVRRCGFYGDPNFYVAQILAAFGGVLSLSLQQARKKNFPVLVITALFLVYCGALSGSKSFLLVISCILALWIVAILRMHGRTGLKVTLFVLFALAAVYVLTSAVFSSLLEVLLTRFLVAKDLESLTTGRIGLWINYFEEIFGNAKVFFLGRGLTSVTVDGRASHNTILQLIYQCGILGAPVVIYWAICFWSDTAQTRQKRKPFDLTMWMIFVGAFMPWLAIDMLFFDEFFLLQWYLLVAWNQQTQPTERFRNTQASLHGGNLWTRK